MENKDEQQQGSMNISSEEKRHAHDHEADNGNDTINQILQKEKLIDPGNEHRHHADTEKDQDNNKLPKHEAGTGKDDRGTMGSESE